MAYIAKFYRYFKKKKNFNFNDLCRLVFVLLYKIPFSKFFQGLRGNFINLMGIYVGNGYFPWLVWLHIYLISFCRAQSGLFFFYLSILTADIF